MGIGWETVFNRRRWKLENYLLDCQTVVDAVAKFQKDGMDPPPDNVLLAYVAGRPELLEPENKDEAQSQESYDQQGEYDELVIIETSE